MLGFHVEAQAQYGTRQVPKLVVNITIDQLRSDYLETFAPQYGETGFKRLFANGLVYENASYPFVNPDKASAISTILTGTTPFYHSIIGEQWLDRSSLRPIACTESPFCDMAVLSAGHTADGAIWLNERTGRWTASQYYSNILDILLLNFNEIRNLSGKKSKLVWQPLNAQGKTDFKHQFKSNRKYQEYQTSGLINSDITHLALDCVSNQSLGDDAYTDLLCLTYYAGHFDHQPVTDCQQELEDTYIRLDQEIGNLIDSLENSVGRGDVLFVITSTGSSDPDGVNYQQYRIPTGTFYINRTANLLNMYLGALWGQGRYVESSFENQLYLNHKLLESKRISMMDATQRAQEFISQMAGVRNVFTSLQLLNASNDYLAKIRNSFNPQRSGDILIEVAPGWHLQNEDTGYDKLSQASATSFPIIIYGANTVTARVQTPVTTDRIAPTIAKSIRIRAPNACTAEPLF